MNEKPLTNRIHKQLETLERALAESQRRPFTELTQGGSSRRHPGARSAATDGLYKTKRTK